MKLYFQDPGNNPTKNEGIKIRYLRSITGILIIKRTFKYLTAEGVMIKPDNNIKLKCELFIIETESVE